MYVVINTLNDLVVAECEKLADAVNARNIYNLLIGEAVYILEERPNQQK